jgi:FAD/FMN-containing dehydrogenase
MNDVIEVPVKSHPQLPGPPRARKPIRIDKLEKDLCKAVQGEVRFDAGSRALYAHDSSNFRQVPIGVVIPRDLDDVVAPHQVCHRHGAPILNRAAAPGCQGKP